ncbi:MAG: S41 family peptidase [Eubacterium sp.]|nr:S41 family peptidase [Eubacterium sp.]
MKNSNFGKGIILGIVIALVVMVSIGGGIYYSIFYGGSSSLSANTRQKMNLMENIINNKYLGKIDMSKMKDGVYKGVVDGLDDPYSVYYTKAEYDELKKSTAGVYTGIGVLVQENPTTRLSSIVRVFPNTPAAKVGLKKGDVIYKIDDKDVSNLGVDKIVLRIKGKENSTFKLQVYRPSIKNYVTVNVKREEVAYPSVDSKLFDAKYKIGYIQIFEFDENTKDQFDAAINSLKKQGVRGLMIDVRDNGGGLYDIVCAMLDELLPKGMIVYTKDKDGKKTPQFSDKNALGLPMVIIQNGNSASASEIFAGAIQDFGAGKIVGEKSYGKGVVQEILPFTDGSAMKLTVEHYYTPKGRDIQGKGITPDVAVGPATKPNTDPQLSTALNLMRRQLVAKQQ